VLRQSRLELVDGEWSAARDEALLLRGFWSEADLLVLAGGRSHELPNCRDGGGYSVVVCPRFSFQFSDLCGKLFVPQGGFAQLDEGANNKDAHPDCPFAVEHVGRHDGAVFRKGIGHVPPAASTL
jgi:hypothetical protein